MATYTTNFNLEKPAQNEAVDVDVLNSNSDIIDDNLGQAKQLALNIGYGYNNAVPYFVGDYCVYQNKLYKCIQNILTPEDFDETKWQQCTLGGELQNIKGNTDDNVTDVLVKLKIGDKVYKICDFANENLANEYSPLSTYEVGDYVIYEDDLYKCITAVSTAEPFDSNKWDECLITDELSSGGSGSGGHTILDNDGTALTQRNEMQFVGTYSEDDSTNEITKVNIVREMTKAEFDLLSDDEKAGIINVTDEAGIASVINGVFVDTDNVIDSGIYNSSNPLNYTATEDCAVLISLISSNSHCNVYINNVNFYHLYSINTASINIYLLLKKGQVLTATTESSIEDSGYTVYGIQQGSQETTKNEIYSTDERAVGTWIDGSTIYQKTFELTTAVIVSNNTWTSTGISKGDIDKIISCEGMTSDGTCWSDLCATTNVNSYINLLTGRNGDTEEVKYFTIRYTKSTT